MHLKLLWFPWYMCGQKVKNKFPNVGTPAIIYLHAADRLNCAQHTM